MFMVWIAALVAAVAFQGVRSVRADPSISYAVTGTGGYLSEWEIKGQLTAEPERKGRTLIGALAMKHTGLCTQDGPEEKAASMRIRIIALRAAPRAEGEIVMNGAICTFSGPIAGTFVGAMNCPDARGVPISFSLQ